MDRKQLVDDWLAQRLETLHAGWRGRLVLAAPEELDGDAGDAVVGTVVGEAILERDPDSDDVIDAEITFCTNYRGGHFVPAEGEKCMTLRASRIEDAQPL